MRFSTNKGLASLPWYFRLTVAVVVIPMATATALFYATRDAFEEFISCYVWEELLCIIIAMAVGARKYNEIEDGKERL